MTDHTRTPIPISVNEHFDSFAAEYDRSAEWCTDQILTDRLTSAVSGRRVLDLGCGTGMLLEAATNAGGRGTGMDLSLAMLFEAANRGGRALVQAAAEHVPFASKSFDVVISRQVLHYTREAEVFREVARILKDDGEFRLAQITAFGAADFPFWSVLKTILQPLRRRYYTTEYLSSLATLCGFEVTQVLRHCVRRRYNMADLFRRSPLDEEGRERVLFWIGKEIPRLPTELQPVVSKDGFAVNQYWTLLFCRLPGSRGPIMQEPLK